MYSNVGQPPVNNRVSLTLARNDRRGKRSELPEDLARKLKSCSVLCCEDWRDLTSYTTYHCFPTGEKNQDRWEIWTQLLRKTREDDSWIPFRGSLVCSHHFRPEDFVNDPLSKRRKLIKNAIPSIFPSFTVDLNDPSYQLPEDEDGDGPEEGDGTRVFTYANDSDSVGYFNDEDDEDEEVFEYEYQTVEDDDAMEFPPMTTTMNAPNPTVHGQARRNHHDNVQTIVQQTNSKNDDRTTAPLVVRSVAPPSQARSPTIMTSAGKIQIISTSSGGVFQQRSSVKNLSTGQRSPVSKAMQTIQLRPGPISATNNVDVKQHLQRKQRVSNLSTQQNATILRQKAREEETKKVLSELPFPLNPDLEVEMIDPVEDLAACRVRIVELEQENRSLITMYENTIEALREKYESQIQNLRKLVKDQETLLNLNQISVTLPAAPAKRVRLS